MHLVSRQPNHTDLILAAPPITSLTAALLSSMKEPPTAGAGWAQLLPPETWEGPWEEFGGGHSESRLLF